MSNYTAEQKRKAVERELHYRRQVFPRRVQNKTMSRELMDSQIAIFEAILADYLALEEKERLV